MKYYIKTFGCQMNISDSERIAGILKLYGFKPLKKNKETDLSSKALAKADLIVFNTCGVRQMAEDRVYGQIHNLVTQGPKIKIILTGCLANRKDVQRRLKKKVDLFTDIKDFQENFEKFLYCHPEFISGSQEMLKQFQHDINYLSISPNHTNKFTAYIPIMTGCNNFCSYCVVPYARGKEISRPVDEIIKEVKDLVKKGYKEIILLGQNVNSYYETSFPEGSTFGFRRLNLRENKNNFSQLLKKINSISGNFWISFVSNHPKDFSDELIETATKLKKVCEYIHLPIQAGDDKVLEKMNRKYTAKHYLGLIKKIKANFKKNKPKKLYSITSDIIVGFPGETKKQFLQSAEIMQRVKYDMVYFGQYSPRPGTVACKMKDNVSKKEKERREQYLNEILKKTSFANNKKYVGKILEVLIDKEKNGVYFGRTRTMKNVRIISERKNLVGKIIKVRITKANVWNLESNL